MEQLLMYRPAAPAPSCPPPAGFTVRSIRQDEGEDWCRCCAKGELGIDEISAELFQNKMLADSSVRLENIFVAVAPDGRIAGTATATLRAEKHPEREGMGGLHMVGVDPDYRGLGLALPLCAAVVTRLNELSLAESRLSTDDFRVPAVKTYLKLGYLPLVTVEGHRERWEEMLGRCGLRSCACYDGEYRPLPDLVGTLKL